MSSSVPALQEVQSKLQSLAGGANMRDAPNQLSPDEARTIENMVLDERGGAGKRLGSTSQGSFGISGDRALSLYTFYRAGLAPQVIMHTSGGKLYYTNDPTANPVVWTQIATGLSTTAPFSFETFNTKVYMSNGVDNYAAWDGATYTTFASAPKGKFLRLFKDAMWVTGVTGFPDRVYTSNAGDAETFGVAAWVDIAKGDGDASTALASDGVFLIVFKQRRTFIIYDPVTLANRVVDFEKGCESHFSVVQFEGQIFFLSRRGICVYLGDAPSRIISGKLDPLFSPEVLNLNALAKCTAYSIENRVGWALPELGNTLPTLQVEYYPRLATEHGGPMVIHRGPWATFTRYRSGTVERLYAGHSAANKFLWAFSNTGTDDGVAFQGLIVTGFFDLNSPDRTKYIRRLRFLGRGRLYAQILRDFQSAIYRTHTVDMASLVDTWSPTDTWGVGSWGPDPPVKEARINTDAFGRYIAFRLTDAETSTGFQSLPVGSKDYSLLRGEWAIYGILIDGDLLGVRS